MKAIYFIILIFMAHLMFSQAPVISFQNFPIEGDTFVYHVDKGNFGMINFYQEDYTWDFSSLQIDTILVAAYGKTSTLGSLAPIFPTSNIYTYGPGAMYGGMGGASPYTNNYGYVFFKTDTSGFYMVGFRNDLLGLGFKNVHSVPEEVLMLSPFSIPGGVMQECRWEFSYNANPANPDTFFVRRSSKTILAIGYGSVITPVATYPSCLMVEENIFYQDSVLVRFGNMVIFDTLVQEKSLSYVYGWSPAHRNFVFRATIDLSAGNVTQISWLFIHITNTQFIYNNSLISMFPNPIKCGEKLFFTEPVIVKIIDINGKVIHFSQIKETELILPFVKPGIYLLQIIEPVYQTHKIIIN